MGKKEFIALLLNPEYEIFIIYIASLTNFNLGIYSSYKLLIFGLILRKTTTIISALTILMVKMVAIAIISFFALGQVGKDFILLKNFLLANASIVFLFWQYRHTICKNRAYLDNLHGDRQQSQ